MGQRLTGPCCASSAEPDGQVITGLDVGRGTLMGSGSSACNVSQSEALPRRRNVGQAEALPPRRPGERAAEDLVQESTHPIADGGNPQCLISCCGAAGADAPTSRLVVAHHRQEPPQHSSPEGLEGSPPEQIQAPVEGDRSSSARCCSSPSSCQRSEWNSASLIRELNSRAASLSLEFAPMPTAGAELPGQAAGLSGTLARR